MSHILYHIPHASLKIPNRFWEICIVNKLNITKSNFILSDLYIDKLAPKSAHKLTFKYSRLFCDVEKFKDNQKENMFKKGMGVIYTRNLEQEITQPSPKYKSNIIKLYYDKHHQKLDKRVTEILNKYNKCIIIDLHSFSDEMVKKLFNKTSTPDICIGTDSYYTDEKLINFTINHFKKYGYSVAVNSPYKGTIIPNKFLKKKDNRLSSIMLEINKRTYLYENKDYIFLQECLNEYYQNILINNY